MVQTEPEYIDVRYGGIEARLAHYTLGNGEKRALILGGIHGREHSGIQVAYELLEHLEALPLHSRFDFLPICNPLAYQAETRFTPRTNRDMAHAFTREPPEDIIEAICQVLLDFADEAQLILNLHSAGDARYLSHIIFYREGDVAEVRSMGFPFAIKRGRPETLANHIFGQLGAHQFSVTIEVGSGTYATKEDVRSSRELILSYLHRKGYIARTAVEIEPTPKSLVWLQDVREFVRAPSEGGFYSLATLGEDFAEGEAFGFWIGIQDMHPRLIRAPRMGKLVYIRTRNRVPKGETLAMFLPPVG